MVGNFWTTQTGLTGGGRADGQTGADGGRTSRLRRAGGRTGGGRADRRQTGRQADMGQRRGGRADEGRMGGGADGSENGGERANERTGG